MLRRATRAAVTASTGASRLQSSSATSRRVVRLSQHVIGGQRSMSSESKFEDALFAKKGNIRTITLNRPKALNALSLPMIRAIRPQVDAWCAEVGDAITSTAVVMDGAGPKAFCAGGDVVSITNAGKSGDALAQDFFREEYELDYRLATMGIPHIALLDGFAMGGGIGLSVHGSFRVATEKTIFAMPETKIGLFPDVGGSHFLPRLDGELGTYLALTGMQLRAQDVLYAGVATHYVLSENIPALTEALAALESFDDNSIAAVLTKFSADPGPTKLFEQRNVVDSCFAFDTIAEIEAALAADGSEFATKLLKTMSVCSPASMAVSLQEVRNGAKLDLAECLKMEYRMSQVFVNRKDFYEGVRAVLIEKDNSPVFTDDADPEPYFAALPADKELVTPPKVKDPIRNGGLPSRDAIVAVVDAGAPRKTPEVKAALLEAGYVLAANAEQPGFTEKVDAVLGMCDGGKK